MRNSGRKAPMMVLIASVAPLLSACEPAQPSDATLTDDVTAVPDPVEDAGDHDAKTPTPTMVDGGGADRAPPDKDAAAASSPSPPKDKAACKTSFSRDVLAAFAQAGCGSLACHGTRFAPKIRIEIADPGITYQELTTYKLGGKPYVKPMSTNADDSAIACHLTGKCGVKMPPGGGSIPTSFQTAVASWLACGAPKN